jgi:hypothetical protein
LNQIISYVLISFVVLVVPLAYEITIIKDVHAPGTWNGQETIHVPIAWCAVRRSPAFENPNIPNPWGGADTTTDEVLWRRHERATDYIYNNNPVSDTGITLRSAINDALHTSLNFPEIDDPNLSPGVPGNLTLVVNLGEEYVRMVHDCKEAWQNMSINGSGAVNGIIALNVRRFVNRVGMEMTLLALENARLSLDYVPLITMGLLRLWTTTSRSRGSRQVGLITIHLIKP